MSRFSRMLLLAAAAVALLAIACGGEDGDEAAGGRPGGSRGGAPGGSPWAGRGGGEAVRLRTELLLRVHAALARRAVETAARGGCGPELERWLTRAEASERAHREWARRNLNPQLLVEGLLLELQADPG